MPRPKPLTPRKFIGLQCPLPLLQRLEDHRIKNYATRSDIILTAIAIGLNEMDRTPSPFTNTRQPVKVEDRQF
jgi:hypothetical protein